MRSFMIYDTEPNCNVRNASEFPGSVPPDTACQQLVRGHEIDWFFFPHARCFCGKCSQK